ncbi:MAG: acetate--CoA ligase family protein, partial [Gammaproteobacteria bacterium]|nr:acetate--CoA ligase family protein [Gammaproteobacteria bacterium]
MTVRNLEFLFKPKSIAVIGVSKRPSSVGAVLAHNLFTGGFNGSIMPVSRKHARIGGVRAYPNIGSLPVAPELAVIATPPDTVAEIIAQLGERGTRAAVVITAGFGETAEGHGVELEQALRDAAKPYLLRIVGPNCLGILVPGVGLNASFSHLNPKAGRLAFVAQSGAIVTSMVDWARARDIGFSHLVSLGDMADVDFGDMLDYLANDRKTGAILLYIESVTSARKFMSAARAAARMKPVIVVKAGRFAEGAKAAASHTGALAGVDEVYQAVFRRAGMLRVFSLQELFDAAESLALVPKVRGDRLVILSNGGGLGVLATDALVEQGGHLAELDSETLAGLNQVLPSTWSQGNPVDIIGDAPGERYAAAFDVLTKNTGMDAILALNCPTAVASSTDAAQAIIDAASGKRGLPLFTSWVGDGAAATARQLFAAQRIPTFQTPEQAVRSFMYLVDYQRNQEMLTQTPPSVPEAFSTDPDKARNRIQAVLKEDRTWLSDPEAKEVMAAYGVPVVNTRRVKTPDEAASVAAELGGTVALKILSPDILHKTDVRGVVLDIEGPAAVRSGAEALLRRLSEEKPDADIQGLTIEPMVRRPEAFELIAGIVKDPQFGPLVLFGQGGRAVEIINDKSMGLPPLNMHLARAVMSRTRIFRQLQGYRGLAAVNLDAVALTLIRLAQLAADFPEIVELDINPLLADEYGVIALDVRIKVEKSSKLPGDHLAIRPYPKELEEPIPLGDGRTLLLRPILPEDEPSLQRGFAKLTPEEIRLRFFVPMRTLSHVIAARFTQIDYDREMALILTKKGVPGKTEIYGVVRIVSDPDNERAEYAVIVRHDVTGMGL